MIVFAENRSQNLNKEKSNQIGHFAFQAFQRLKLATLLFFKPIQETRRLETSLSLFLALPGILRNFFVFVIYVYNSSEQSGTP